MISVFIALLRNLKNYFGAFPLGLVFGETKVIVFHRPHDLFIRSELHLSRLFFKDRDPRIALQAEGEARGVLRIV
jgi:hypothetical protein